MEHILGAIVAIPTRRANNFKKKFRERLKISKLRTPTNFVN